MAVLTHGAWTRHWGSDPDVLGATVRLDRQPFTVVGVLPPDYVPPEALWHGTVEVYFPLSHVHDDVTPSATSNHFLQALGRLRPGVPPEAGQEELRSIQQELFDELPSPPEGRTARAVPLHDVTVGDFGRAMVPFLAAVGILLLVACVNVANLFLVRAAERVREIRLRRSLGAGAGRLLRQLVTESTVLCLLAAGLGALLAYGGVALFRELAPAGIPRASEVAVDLRVLGIAAGLGLLTGVVFGLVPALSLLRGSWGNAGAGLRSGSGRASPGAHGSAGEGMRRTRGALVVAEVAVALTLFIGAGLLANSFLRLVATDLGFEPEGVVYLSAFPEGERYETPEGRIAWTREVTERIAALPGVASVSGTNNPPLDLNRSTRNVTVDGYGAEGEDGPTVSYHRVLPGFFETMGIPRLAGRVFTQADDGTGGVPVVVTEAMARAYWDPDEPARAVGGRLHFGDASTDRPWMEVVGVVGDVRQRSPARAPAPELYVPWLAFPADVTHLVARTAGPGVDEAAVVRGMRSAVQAADPDVPIRAAGPYASIVADRLLTPRFRTSLLSLFAGTALLLALVGVYATLAYSVRQRRHELGVRMALGAPAARLRAMVLGRGMALTATGIVVGLGLSLLGTRLLESMVYGVTPTDPATFVGASALMALAAVGACWLPARRATRVDPLETLRAE